jgi:periplasmic divalent cation tolerance protein
VTTAVVVLSTAGSPDEAERIATTLVDERLAACVNLVAPLTSIYRWQGAVERAAEVLLVIKTRKRLVPRLIGRLEALHSYEVPEAIVLPIVAGARPYLEWLLGETATPVTRTRTRSGSRRRSGNSTGSRRPRA